MFNKQKVEEFLKREGLNSLTEINPDDEGHFIWLGCDICNDQMANTVFDCNGFNPKTGEIQETYLICFDCLNFINNGEEPE